MNVEKRAPSRKVGRSVSPEAHLDDAPADEAWGELETREPTMSDPNQGNRRKGRSALLGVLALGLGVSLAGNLLLVRSNNEYYRQICDVRLDPPGLKTYAADRAAAAPTEKPVLAIFGDSRAAMWSAPVAELSEFTIRDVGVGNQTTAQALLRFDADVPRLHPAVIVLEAGVNDLKTVAEFPQRRAELIADCEKNIAQLVEKSRATGASVVLTTIFSIGDIPLWRKPFWSNDVDDVVREVNTFVRGLAGDKVVILDADPVLDRDDGKIQKPFQFDFLHVSPAGYAALNQRLVPIVKQLGAARASGNGDARP